MTSTVVLAQADSMANWLGVVGQWAGSGLPEDNRERERRLASVVGRVGWFFVFDALDYGRLWGQRPGVVGHTCRSELLVGLLQRSRPVARFARGSSGRARAAPVPGG